MFKWFNRPQPKEEEKRKPIILDVLPHSVISLHNLCPSDTYKDLLDYADTTIFGFCIRSYYIHYSKTSYSMLNALFSIVCEDGEVVSVKPYHEISEPVVTLCNKMLANPFLFEFEEDSVYYKGVEVLTKDSEIVETSSLPFNSYYNYGFFLYQTPKNSLTRSEVILVSGIVGIAQRKIIKEHQKKERENLTELLGD